MYFSKPPLTYGVILDTSRGEMDLAHVMGACQSPFPVVYSSTTSRMTAHYWLEISNNGDISWKLAKVINSQTNFLQ